MEISRTQSAQKGVQQGKAKVAASTQTSTTQIQSVSWPTSSTAGFNMIHLSIGFWLKDVSSLGPAKTLYNTVGQG